MSSEKLNWKVLKSKTAYKHEIFKLTVDKCKLPDGRISSNYFVCEFPNWVNIVALTKKHELILIKQYRHGSKEVCIETAGGIIDHKFKESPLKAAKRELREETGYESKKIVKISSQRPNPAVQNNYLHVFLALDCEEKFSQDLDPNEEIQVFTCTIEAALKMIKTGKINHSLIISSIFLALQHIGYNITLNKHGRGKK